MLSFIILVLIHLLFEPHRENTCFLHICENKGADQLCGNRASDQRFCFGYIDGTFPLLGLHKTQNFKLLAIFCGCRAWSVSDLVGNPEDRFSLGLFVSVSCD